VVERVVERGPAMIDALLKLGADFDVSHEPPSPGRAAFDLGREGGHTHRRILHHRDATGREIERVLLSRARAHPNIALFEDHCGVDLLTTSKLGWSGPARVIGAYVLDAEGSVLPFQARVTLLATGGAGKVYLYTSNPDIASGDGMAMAYRAGATLANMEFVQFHPTCLYHPQAKSFLISEAVRGEGAILRTQDGAPIMAGLHPLADLAPRDIVARAIDAALKRTGDHWVLLDITHKDAAYLRERFPNIYRAASSSGSISRARRSRWCPPPTTAAEGSRPICPAKPTSPTCSPRARSRAPDCTAPTGSRRTRCSRRSCSPTRRRRPRARVCATRAPTSATCRPGKKATPPRATRRS
jgi:L-aspartate oxidase